MRRKGARNACAVRVAGLVRAHGANGGRGDAPAAAGAGARGGGSDGAGPHGAAGCAAGCGEARFLPPVAQSFALPCRSRSWFRCPASGRFGPSAQQPTGLTLPFAPLDTRNAGAVRVAGLVRAHGANGGRGDAPTAAGAGARGGASDGARTHGPAVCAAACRKPRFLRRKGARNARAVRPPFAAKTAHATASVGWVWDPPVSERRQREYRAQRGRPLTAAERANQHRAYQHERSTKTPCSN